ncbi:MAG TPA: tRNA (cytidine(34)-2'-O)-methyltransferase [Alphaproteobacteria bacterium]|nr:tRNA (cytidine(34)-2'-O)-methyltransferase [Alphaproteobacteria bacterium]
MLHIALYQPDIPQNVGAAMRLCACLGIPLDIIEPCGFPWDMRKIRQSGMDYIDQTDLIRHESWNSFKETYKDRRLVLMTTKSSEPYTAFNFSANDILLAGRESAGVPEEIHQEIKSRITIPMAGQARSLNIINATAIITGEALRQINTL